MTIEMHASIAESERGGRIFRLEPDGGNSEGALADLFARLGAMRRMLGATTFAVFAAQGTGSAIGGQLSMVLGDSGGRGDEIVSLASPSGKALLAHAEKSTLPLSWRATGSVAAAGACTGGTIVRAELADMRTDGVAFPVRLGAIGNGIVVFEGEGLHLTPGIVFGAHRMAYRLLGDLLRIEMARSAPRQSLSDRELECLQWAGGGYKSEAIAEKLGLSVHTVNAYLSTATAKLDSVNRIQAIAKAIRLGFIA